MAATNSEPLTIERWQRRHLLGLQDLQRDEIELILDHAAEFKKLQQSRVKLDHLRGVVVANLFFEPSTRTRTSFSLAAKRLGADTVDFTASGSSVSKGETFIDTALTIEAMGVDLVVIRHSSPGAPEMLSRHVKCGILNAGDGTHEHPTQGLLDAFTMREKLGSFEGKTVTLVGDIKHSRVARSNIWALTKLGAKVIVCGPATLIPPGVERLGVTVAHRFDDVLQESDAINLLRVQFERQRGAFFPSIAEYAHLFGMNGDRLRRAKPNVLILAPGPINRGVEITPDVADGPNSQILQQVSNGLFVRMACLHLLARRQQQLQEAR
ncbi:aspartate carbamoyltransferase catalytic subunit [Planctomicrobium piriforme]|uniref:Aspartate carbamoyltransferase n=1 Tax=Planctomicrobium piriforme TaxID=1576369 RepID=A0A1I3FW77_9PLAN|nr:aspartate carbamoyltransferase catalytic subunit [Planctomicrobium piriforme]SFI15417.1 aspartate carbamoyltransferase catalytic subunit [Planctomicrobium piriforme]